MSRTQGGSAIISSAHLGIKFLLHIRPAGRCQDIVQHDECVALKVKRQISATKHKTRQKRETPAHTYCLWTA